MLYRALILIDDIHLQHSMLLLISARMNQLIDKYFYTQKIVVTRKKRKIELKKSLTVDIILVGSIKLLFLLCGDWRKKKNHNYLLISYYYTYYV